MNELPASDATSRRFRRVFILVLSLRTPILPGVGCHTTPFRAPAICSSVETMTRPAMKYLAILAVLGLGACGLLFRALWAKRENRYSPQGQLCAAPAWTPPVRSEAPQPVRRPGPSRASLNSDSAPVPSLARPAPLPEATNGATQDIAGDEHTAELIAAQIEISQAQLHVKMLEAKGRTQEADERRSSLEALKRRAAALREQVGLGPETPAGGSVQQTP